MRITESQLRRIVREEVANRVNRGSFLNESAYGALTTVYHVAKINMDEWNGDMEVLAVEDDKADPYGGGLFCTINPPTGISDNVLKIPVNLSKFLILDEDVCMRVHGDAVSPMEQVNKMRNKAYLRKAISNVENLRLYSQGEFSADVAHDIGASPALTDLLQGVVFTSRREGKCVIIYDLSEVYPMGY
jgi:hypothetical protein